MKHPCHGISVDNILTIDLQSHFWRHMRDQSPKCDAQDRAHVEQVTATARCDLLTL